MGAVGTLPVQALTSGLLGGACGLRTPMILCFAALAPGTIGFLRRESGKEDEIERAFSTRPDGVPDVLLTAGPGALLHHPAHC